MKKDQYDFDKELNKIKKQLVVFSKEAAVLAKKGEKELFKFSKKSKLHIDESTAKLKREHLLYLIGKEYVKAKCPGRHTVKLNKFIGELDKADKGILQLKTKIKSFK